MEIIRIVIAHNQNLFRLGINSLLAHEPGIMILAEATNERELLEVLNNFAVDVLLLDPAIPLLHGHLSCQVIRQRYPATEMIIFSSSSEDKQAAHYQRLGIISCLDKLRKGYPCTGYSAGALPQGPRKLYTDEYSA